MYSLLLLSLVMGEAFPHDLSSLFPCSPWRDRDQVCFVDATCRQLVQLHQAEKCCLGGGILGNWSNWQLSTTWKKASRLNLSYMPIVLTDATWLYAYWLYEVDVQLWIQIGLPFVVLTIKKYKHTRTAVSLKSYVALDFFSSTVPTYFLLPVETFLFIKLSIGNSTVRKKWRSNCNPRRLLSILLYLPYFYISVLASRYRIEFSFLLNSVGQWPRWTKSRSLRKIFYRVKTFHTRLFVWADIPASRISPERNK